MKPNKFIFSKALCSKKTFLLLFCSFALLLFCSLQTSAQINCAGQDVSTCVKYPTQTYQCIDGDFLSSSLFGNQLLFPAQAANTPQFLIVRGKIRFNFGYTFAAGSDILFLDNNSGFIVEPNQTLDLTSSTLYGCTQLWNGIEVLDGATIIANSCTFEDAKAAITLRNKTVVLITNNTFRKNVCGILGVPSSQASTISISAASKMGISGNYFWGDDQLLQPFAPSSISSSLSSGNVGSGTTQYPNAGIWIDRVSALSVGHNSNLPGAGLNVFLNFGVVKELNVRPQGIRAINSSLLVRNSIFENFGKYVPSSTALTIDADAIFARNDQFAIPQITVIGDNTGTGFLQQHTFSNCLFDIRTRGTNLTVSNIASYKSGGSISAFSTDGNVSNSVSITIENSFINQFSQYGIDVNTLKRIALRIFNNRIYSNNELGDPSPKYGIFVRNTYSAGGSIPLRTSTIIDNDIRSYSQQLDGFFGIATQKISYLNIGRNRIQDLGDLEGFYGIRTINMPNNNLRILSNMVTGKKIDYGFIDGQQIGFGAGIFLNESVNSLVNCNQVDQMNTGILFTSMCDNTTLSKNLFNFHDKGLSLGEAVFGTGGASIGTQKGTENRWLGSNSIIEAFAGDLASALSSPFLINSSDLNSEYWPTPRKIGPDDDNSIWFNQLEGLEPSNDFTCINADGGLTVLEPEGRIADSDIRLIENTYIPPYGYPALTWEAKWNFADRLNSNPGLIGESPIISSYYVNKYNDNYSQLNRIYQDWQNRWSPNSAIFASVEAQQLNLNNLIAQRFALDDQLSESLGGNNATTHTQMFNIDADISSTSTAIANTSNVLVTETNQNVNNLLTEIETVNTTESFESDMKTVLKTMLQSHTAGGELTETQIAQVKAVADKCRYSGGYAVVLARGFFEHQDSYKQDMDCTKSGERQDQSVVDASALVSISPNPTQESAILRIDQPFENGTITLFNAQGTMIRTADLLHTSTKIDLNGLPQGIYMVHIRFDNSAFALKKILKTN